MGVRAYGRRIAVGVGVAACLSACGGSGPGIYWSSDDEAIGRADLDGSDANRHLIGGLDGVRGVAVAAGRVYWATNSDAESTIGRAGLDGSDVDQRLVQEIGPRWGGPTGVATDATRVYWATYVATIFGHGGQVGSAKLDGTNVDQEVFDGGGYAPSWVAVNSHHIYWTNFDDGNIGRGRLDGTHLNYDFITAGNATGLAVDGAHIYWANDSSGSESDSIGRADLDGRYVDQYFIPGARGPKGVAVDATHVYWANAPDDLTDPPGIRGSIGRARLDGTDVDQDFIGDLNSPDGVAVDAPLDH